MRGHFRGRFYGTSRVGQLLSRGAPSQRFQGSANLGVGPAHGNHPSPQAEDEFGVTLFDRIKRPIQLTSEGSTLLELVTPVVTSIETLKTGMDYAERRGSFQVGAYPDLIKNHMPLGVREFSEAYPKFASGCWPALTIL